MDALSISLSCCLEIYGIRPWSQNRKEPCVHQTLALRSSQDSARIQPLLIGAHRFSGAQFCQPHHVNMKQFHCFL